MPFVFIAIAVFLAAILFPEAAWAWGPSTHLVIGKQVLDSAVINSVSFASLLTSNPLDFLYGSMFADMHLGKKFFVFARLAHNWRVGFRLLEAAQTDANRACAYGYLSHLAADTIAHNDFIPRKLIEQYNKRGRGHLFFETAFDAMLPKDPYLETKEVVIEGSAHNDVFLETTLTRTLFSFQTNRRFYRGLLTVNRNKRIKAFQRWRARSISALEEIEVMAYLARCDDIVEDFLLRERAGACYGVDPHGKEIIKRATRMRRRLREKMRKKTLAPDEVKRALDALRDNSSKQR